MKLWEYSGKRVRIIDIDGQRHVGFIEFYTSELDDPDGIACLSLRPDYNPDRILIDFTESEIADIEVLSANAPQMTETAQIAI